MTKPVIGICCEAHKLAPKFSQFELSCDYRYVRSVIRAGGVPILLPINGNLKDIKTLVQLINGLIIVGGNDIPPRFYQERVSQKIRPMYEGRVRFDMNLYRLAQRRKIPILAICYGMQLLNVIYGGSLYQDIQKQVPGAKSHRSKESPAHQIHLEDCALAKMLGRKSFLVHSSHHQAVKKIGRSLRAVGYSSDRIVEVIEGPPNTIAVQWHPERQEKDPLQRKLFNHFIKLCQK
jgi:putative glutamine amidotransferase